MTIPRSCSDQASYPDAAAGAAQRHAQEAFEQGARFAAALAIARWSGHDQPGVPARAAWFARAQDDLGKWFDAGGFSQHAPVPEDRAAPLPFPGSRPRLYTQFRKSGSTSDEQL